MKFEQLVLKKGAIKNIQYVGIKEQMDHFDGEKGTFTRHELIADGQPFFHVITKGSADKIPPFTKVEIIGGKLVIDAVHAQNMTPALNIKAESIVVVK
ncbi:TPA: hypothetical protein U2C93_001603 [Streptococcus suis]|uniref:hypothetical protein n=1 Tax=Streptococcus suis TaxID=1307 RepID=UPI001294B9DF|nr:hypothetical protein [Streptococcus suis]NQP26682.1 hypothetical protein [Streptococcus suis]NQP37821.1 hypothetical protein [Streptococcus suis]NQR30165.1 hypothetical protein [Streptococcus suis]NQR38358.1 hypothetical protein [Streptococcus suis]HEL1549478.1 hypothetical protein [Streptococcus suis]